MDNELERLLPTLIPGVAEANFSIAYGVYMKDAEAGQSGILPGPIVAVAIPAMASSFAFMQGDSRMRCCEKMVTGLAAFWESMAANPDLFFTDAIAIRAPTFSRLAENLYKTLGDNQRKQRSLRDSAAAIAADIHAATDEQGAATFPGPVEYPIT